jgi:hypothetical protein
VSRVDIPVANIPEDIVQLRNRGSTAPATVHELTPGRRVVLERLSNVQPTAVEPIWGGRLLRNKVNNLQGATGLGKTLIAVDMAARWTIGSPFPGDAEPHEPGTVLMFYAEDSAGDTLRPRLEAVGGDPSRFFVTRATVTTNEAGVEAFGVLSLADNAPIVSAIRDTGASLLIVDPVTSFLGARVDMNKANEVRPVLEGLGRIASDLGVTVLLILHVGKAAIGPSHAVYRALGSVDMANVARSVLTVAERDGKRFLAHAKNNLLPRASTLEYSIGASGHRLGELDVPCILWGGASQLTADELFATTTHIQRATTLSDNFVCDAVLEALETPLSAQELENRVRGIHGVPKHQFERVRAELAKNGRIGTTRSGFQGAVAWHRTVAPLQPVYTADTPRRDYPIAPEGHGEE